MYARNLSLYNGLASVTQDTSTFSIEQKPAGEPALLKVLPQHQPRLLLGDDGFPDTRPGRACDAPNVG